MPKLEIHNHGIAVHHQRYTIACYTSRCNYMLVCNMLPHHQLVNGTMAACSQCWNSCSRHDVTKGTAHLDWRGCACQLEDEPAKHWHRGLQEKLKRAISTAHLISRGTSASVECCSCCCCCCCSPCELLPPASPLPAITASTATGSATVLRVLPAATAALPGVQLLLLCWWSPLR